MSKTRIKFFGVQAAPYPGAARAGCMPTDSKAVSWHVVVGGAQCSIEDVSGFAEHFGDFLNMAYRAGASDAKAEMRERLGL